MLNTEVEQKGEIFQLILTFVIKPELLIRKDYYEIDIH